MWAKTGAYMTRFLILLMLPSLLWGVSTSAPVSISSVGGNSSPQIALADNGNAVALWTAFPNQIFVSNFTATTGLWSGPVTLTLGNAPQLAIDGTGNAIVVWVTSTSQINASRFDVATQTWSAAVLVSSTGGVNTFPQIAMNGNGVALVVWLQSTNQVLASSFNPNTFAFSTPTTFLSNTNPAGFQLDNNNTGIAIWQSFPTGLIQTSRIFVP